MSSSSRVYTRSYSGFSGVDFSGEPSEIPATSFSYLENMYRDYTSGTGAGIETIPGYRQVTDLGAKIHAIHPHPERSGSMLIHAGSALYRQDSDRRDEGETPKPLKAANGKAAVLASGKSRGAILDGALFLVDGERYRVVRGDVVESLEDKAYVPTIYSDGSPLEQPNLLTDRAREEYHLLSLESFSYASDGLIFSVSNLGVCMISGYTGSEEVVVLPTEAEVGLLRYTVAGVAKDAFRHNNTIRTLVIPSGITVLEPRAFFGMHALEVAVLPNTVTATPLQCFGDCPKLHTFYLPLSLAELGDHLCDSSVVTTVCYEGSLAQFTALPGYVQLMPLSLPEGYTTHFNTSYPVGRYLFPLHMPTDSVLSCTLNGEAVPDKGAVFYRAVKSKEGTVEAIYLEAENKRSLEGKTLSCALTLQNVLKAALAEEGIPYTGSGASAINGCTLIARFDDRLFLSGNPALPGMTFFTHRRANGHGDPAYLGCYDRFTDGDGRLQVRSLLPTPGALLLLTEDAPDAPSLFCHEGWDTGEEAVPRAYPVTAGIGGLGSIGPATLFLGEALFLSARGLEAIEESTLHNGKTLVHRSSAVDVRLLREELSEADLFRYGTYLGISVGGRVYLADGRRRPMRDGHREYEWYFLSGIGAFPGDAPRYRYVTGEIPPGLKNLSVSLSAGKAILETAAEEGYADGLSLFSVKASGTTVTYAERNGHAYLVTCDGERYGGSFSPATVFFECDGLLYFGTECGRLHVFNTDMREENGIIPRRYYSFSSHSYLSGCATKIDNCDLPHMRKSTVRSGGAVRLKAMTGGKLEVRVRTEDGSFTTADTLYGGLGDFSETDFASAEFHRGDDVILPLREAKRRWVEKQLYFVSEEYQRPFGLLSVTYQYRVAGRI